MEFFFHPKSVAVVGATPNKAKGGYAILKNLINTFQGKIYPVNPRYAEIEGLPCYRSVAAVPGKPDLAILFIAAARVVETVEACIAKGIPGVIIQSGGFAEIGSEGKALQTKLSSLAKETSTRIWGPNCMGLVDGKLGHVFSFTDPQVLAALLKPGPVSLVVQSGMISAGFVVDLLSHEISGFNKVCSIGNKADVNECDLLTYLLEDADTGVVGFYLESFVDLRRFIDIYLCSGGKKPVVVLKGGKSETGRQAALSHTASLAGHYRIAAAALEQAGIHLARDFHQMVDLCRTLEMVKTFPPAKNQNLAILTISGASGIVASDFLDDFGFRIAALEASTRLKLATFFPDWMPAANPVDIWPAVEQHSGTDLDICALSLDAILADASVDACMIHTFAGFSRVRINLSETARLSHKWQKPVFIWALGERDRVLAFQVEASKLGIPVFHELYRAVECLAESLKPQPSSDLISTRDDEHDVHSIKQITLPITPGVLDEHASKLILQDAGLPTVEEYLTENVEDCRLHASEMGYPVFLKGLEKGVLHKSEKGLIRAGICHEAHLREAYHQLKTRMSSEGKVLLQQSVKGSLELILGYLRDPQYGPSVMVGMGGIFAESFGDTVFALAPLSEAAAVNLIGHLKNSQLLRGARGIPPAPVEQIAHYLVTLGKLGAAFPSIREIDINPLLMSDSGPVIVDASIILD